MTKKFVTSALMITGIVFASATISFAQAPAAGVAKVRRIVAGQEKFQPVAASTVALDSKMDLSADQRAQISSMNVEVASLQSERTRLWSELRAVKGRADYNDEMAATQAAPRMQRIMEINAKLAPIVSKQDVQVSAILNGTQRSQLAKMMTSTKASL